MALDQHGAFAAVLVSMAGDSCVQELEELRPGLSEGLQPLFDTVLSKILTYLEECADGDAPVLEYRSPEELELEIGSALSLPREGLGLKGIVDQLEPVLRFSPKTSHVHFFNQLFAGFDVPSILADFVTAALNTTSYTYEIGPVTTLIEKRLIQRLLELVGFEDGDGVFAPGGSISNLMAFLAARHVAVPGSRKRGLGGAELVCFTSAQGHYSLRRAAMIGGIGMGSVIKVPCDKEGVMIPSELDRLVSESKAAGKLPFLTFATAGTTVLGQFDPISSIADVCQRHGMWFHIDGCLGSSVLFSKKHAGLMAGCEKADSIAWNPHKMLGIGLQCSCILVKKKGVLKSCNSSKADYLFHKDAVDVDVGDMTLQCGRRLDTLKLWLSWKARGDEGFEYRVDHAFEMASYFHELIRSTGGRFRLVTERAASVCSCFWVLPSGVEDPVKEADAVSAYAHRLRKIVTKRGRLLINYQPLVDQGYPYFFRIVTHNPLLTTADLDWVVEEFNRAIVVADASA